MNAAPASWPPPEAGSPSRASGDGSWRSTGYRSSWLRGRIVIGILLAVVASDLVGTLVDLEGLGLIGAAEAGTLSDAEAAAYDERDAAVGMVQLVLYVASAVAVLAWLSRVVDNVPPLTGRTPRRSPREAIGWWFVPLANYVVPYQVVSDTLRRLGTGDDDVAESLLLPWWGLWLVSNVLGSLLFRLPMTTLDEIRTVLYLTAGSDITHALAGIMLLVIVRSAERQSETRAATLGLGRASTPAWPQAVLQAPLAPVAIASGPAGIETVVVDGSGPLQPPPPPPPPAQPGTANG